MALLYWFIFTVQPSTTLSFDVSLWPLEKVSSALTSTTNNYTTDAVHE